jgi:hypothetical protein
MMPPNHVYHVAGQRSRFVSTFVRRRFAAGPVQRFNRAFNDCTRIVLPASPDRLTSRPEVSMTERNEAQKAADKFREALRGAAWRLPPGVTVVVQTIADLTSGNAPHDEQSIRAAGRGYQPEVRMLAAQIAVDRHGYADLEVGARPVRALFFLNVDEVELRGVTLEEGQNEWPGMMDDVRRWVRGVTVEELIRADQEGWARTVEWESRTVRS